MLHTGRVHVPTPRSLENFRIRFHFPDLGGYPILQEGSMYQDQGAQQCYRGSMYVGAKPVLQVFLLSRHGILANIAGRFHVPRPRRLQQVLFSITQSKDITYYTKDLVIASFCMVAQLIKVGSQSVHLPTLPKSPSSISGRIHDIFIALIHNRTGRLPRVNITADESWNTV